MAAGGRGRVGKRDIAIDFFSSFSGLFARPLHLSHSLARSSCLLLFLSHSSENEGAVPSLRLAHEACEYEREISLLQRILCAIRPRTRVTLAESRL